MKLNLVKITDTSGVITGESGGVTYQGLTDDELDSVYVTETAYSYMGRDFSVEKIGDLVIFPDNHYNSIYVELQAVARNILKESVGQLDYALIPIKLIEELQNIVKVIDDEN